MRDQTPFLFDPKPYSRRPERRRAGRNPALNEALLRLRQTLLAIPPEEQARRRERAAALEKAIYRKRG